MSQETLEFRIRLFLYNNQKPVSLPELEVAMEEGIDKTLKDLHNNFIVFLLDGDRVDLNFGVRVQLLLKELFDAYQKPISINALMGLARDEDEESSIKEMIYILIQREQLEVYPGNKVFRFMRNIADI